MDIIKKLLLEGPPQMADKDLTSGGLAMLLIVLIGTGVVLYLFSRYKQNWFKHYATLFVVVFLFEVFTSPMWINNHFGTYGYLYQDVTWVLTMGWTTLMLGVIMLVEYVCHQRKAWQRFLFYILGMSVFGFLGEALVMRLGLRAYSTEIQEAVSGIMLLNVPIDTFYYVPVFSSLVIGTYLYFAYGLDKRAVVPTKGGWTRRFILAFVAVLLFEIMIEPMVINANMPEWSYVFRDLSIILTLGWVLLMWVSWILVETFWKNFSLFEKYCLSVAIVGMLAIPVKALTVAVGFRIYGGSTAEMTFSGVSFLGLPIEVIVAIPMYFALVFGFVKAWDVMLTNVDSPLLLIKRKNI